MDRIVDQVVNPKIHPNIDPEVETIICNYFGVDKPSESEGKFLSIFITEEHANYLFFLHLRSSKREHPAPATATAGQHPPVPRTHP